MSKGKTFSELFRLFTILGVLAGGLGLIGLETTDLVLAENHFEGTKTVISTLASTEGFLDRTSLELWSPESELWSAVIDPADEYAYFGTNTDPGMVARMRLADFEQVDVITMKTGEDGLFSGVIDQTLREVISTSEHTQFPGSLCTSVSILWVYR